MTLWCLKNLVRAEIMKYLNKDKKITSISINKTLLEECKYTNIYSLFGYRVHTVDNNIKDITLNYEDGE